MAFQTFFNTWTGRLNSLSYYFSKFFHLWMLIFLYCWGIPNLSTLPLTPTLLQYVAQFYSILTQKHRVSPKVKKLFALNHKRVLRNRYPPESSKLWWRFLWFKIAHTEPSARAKRIGSVCVILKHKEPPHELRVLGCFAWAGTRLWLSTDNFSVLGRIRRFCIEIDNFRQRIWIEWTSAI